MDEDERLFVFHLMIGFGRFKVWVERDDDGDVSVGVVLFGLKLSYLFERKAHADPIEPT